MKQLLNIFALVGTLTPCLAATADAEGNWPQWRGPNMTGAAPNANPPTKWSETENIKWKTEVTGESFSTPIIWGKQIFLQAAVPTGKKIETPAAAEPPPQPQGQGRGRRGGFGGGQKPTEYLEFSLQSFDKDTGKLNWKKVAKEAVPHEGHHQTSAYASGSPATDGQRIFAFFGSQGLHCYDLQGNLQWSKDLGKMQILLSFGEGSSPALHGNTVVINWDHEGEDFIAAFDKNSGKELWRQPRDEKTSWSTPLIVEHGGKPQVITTATGKIRSYDLATGQQVWEHAGLTRNVIPTPVYADGVLYATSGYQGAALYAIKLGKTGDLTDSDAVLWKHAKSTPYVPSPLLSGDRLYFFAGNNATLSVFNIKNGQPIIDAERVTGLNGIYSSPIAAGGRVYLASQNGATVVIKDSDKLEILATNQLDDSFNASPAVVGNQLFLRGKKNLYCIAEK